MSERVEPMTAAAYREAYPNALSVGDKWARKTIAALEERERLLAEREAHAEDARVGALVREIRKQTELRWQGPYIVKVGTGVSYGLNETGLQSALDALRPKAPVREVGPSGWWYGRNGREVGVFLTESEDQHIATVATNHRGDLIGFLVPPADRALVARLLGEVGE